MAKKPNIPDPQTPPSGDSGAASTDADRSADPRELWNQAREVLSPVELHLGSYFTHQALFQPRHLLFTLSRYKFAAKLLADKGPLDILELGCAEGLGTIMFSEGGRRVTAVDFDEESIRHARETLGPHLGIDFRCEDFLGKSFGQYDAVVSLDVIEHITPSDEDRFMKTVVSSLKPKGMCVIGTPNSAASAYASEASQIGHVNLYDHDRLTALFHKHFHYVFMFGMNDEVAHTGFPAMRHYLFALGCDPREST